jgi:hypothetical protein
MSNLYKCKPRQVRKFVIDCIQAGLVPYIQSSPGMGKSAITKQIARDFNLWLIDHRLSTSEPTDMTGLPMFVDGRAKFAPFSDLFPLQNDPLPRHLSQRTKDASGRDVLVAGPEYEGWLLFFDELPSAPRSVQAAAYKVMLDRMIGQHKLHKNVAIVAAGNLMTDRAIVNPLSTAMQSRLVHLEMEIDFDQWLEDVALKENYDPRVIAFLMQFPNKLMDFKPDHHEKTFCCPRTWEFVDRLIRGREVTDESAILLTGAITSGVAMEFVQFTKIYSEMINITDIRKDPDNCRLPQEKALKWAVITHLMEKINDENFKDLTTYIDRFDLSFRILFYRSILIRRPELRVHPLFGTTVGKITQYLHS